MPFWDDNGVVRGRHTRELWQHDWRAEIAKLCPVPSQAIVKELIDAHKKPFSPLDILPWRHWGPNDYYPYNMEDVKFFARILTILHKLGVHGPAQLQRAGGGLPLLPLDIPLIVSATLASDAKSSSSSSGGLTEAKNSEDARTNVLSNEIAGLHDAAAHQNPVLLDPFNQTSNLTLQALVQEGQPKVTPEEKRKQDEEKLKKFEAEKYDSEIELQEYQAVLDRSVENTHRIYEELYQALLARVEEKEQLLREIAEVKADMKREQKALESDEPPEQAVYDTLHDLSEKEKDLQAALALNEDKYKAEEEEMQRLEAKLSQITLPEIRNRRAAERSVENIPREQFSRLDNGSVSRSVEYWSPSRVARLCAFIRRRLQRTRLSREQKNDVEMVLSPRIGLDDDEMDDPGWYDNAETELWAEELGPSRPRRYLLIQRIAKYLLVPITGVSVAGLLLHNNRSSEGEDELILLFLAFPNDHWFRQLPLRTWRLLVSMTSRQDNYLLLQQVANPELLHFTYDENVLWNIDYLFFDETNKNQQLALEWFNNVTKPDVAYRTKNAANLNMIAKLTNEAKDNLLLDARDICYVCRNDNRALHVVATFYGSVPAIQPTRKLLSQASIARKQIATESEGPTRTQQFDGLVAAFAELVSKQPNYFSEWIREMKRRRKVSKFYDQMPEDAFENFIQEIATNPQRYPSDAKDIVGDFLLRYSTKRAFLPLTIQINALKWDEDISGPTSALLQEMKSYHNNGEFDALGYDVFLSHWDKRSAQVEKKSFEAAVVSLELSKNAKLLLFYLLGAIDQGLVAFLQQATTEIQESESGVPDMLVGLHKQPEARDALDFPQENIDRRVPSSSHNRTVLFSNDDPTTYDYANSPFIRTSRYVLLPVGLVSCFMITTEANQKYANFFTISNPHNIIANPNSEIEQFDVQLWKKPIEESNMSYYTFYDDTWSAATFKLGLWTGMVYTLSRIRPDGPSAYMMAILGSMGGVGQAMIGTGLSYSTELMAAAKDLTFKQAAVITTAASVWWYGPETIAEVVKDVGNGVFYTAVGLGVLMLVVNQVTTGKKRKRLF